MTKKPGKKNEKEKNGDEKMDYIWNELFSRCSEDSG